MLKFMSKDLLSLLNVNHTSKGNSSESYDLVIVRKPLAASRDDTMNQYIDFTTTTTTKTSILFGKKITSRFRYQNITKRN